MHRLLRLFDLLGVGVFAVSGALAAGRLGLDWLGVCIVAALPAVGGGTLRDLLLGRPVFWVRDAAYLHVVLAAAALTIGWVRWLPVPSHALLVADALGLALFAISGAEVAEAQGRAPIIVVLMGTVTGTFGGLLRDVVTNQVPMLLRADIYATAAIAGVSLHLLLQRVGVPRPAAFVAGMAAIAALRFAALAGGWSLPTFHVA